MFGAALVFQGVELDNMAKAVTPSLFEAILRGKEVAPVTRFRPTLSPAASLNMFERGIPFQGDSR